MPLSPYAEPTYSLPVSLSWIKYTPFTEDKDVTHVVLIPGEFIILFSSLNDKLTVSNALNSPIDCYSS